MRKNVFLALVTHELKSPLTAILSWADLAKDDPSVREEALDIILRSAHAQRRIIDDLLDISKVLYGKLTLEVEPLDAWLIACQAAENQRAALEQRQLTLALQPPVDTLPVLADPVRLGQIITNLLNNALKFTPPGGTITLAGCREGTQARLQVRDTGIGIPPAQLPTIFQRFQQLDRERLSGGLGLGLAVVKGLIDLHGGHVEVASAGTNKGTTFTVWLPLRQAGE